MNINKSSWHFKLLNKLDFKVARLLRYEDSVVTLCQYFWNVVGAILISVVIGFMMAFLVLGSLFILSGMVIGLIIFFGASWLPVIEYGGVVDTMYTVGLSVCLVFAVIQTFELMKAQVREGKIVPNWMKFSKQEIKPNKEVKPNILFEYVKAKKNKFCPVVKLED